MMRTRLLVLLVPVLALSACEKVVEVNGHRVDPIASAADHVQIATRYLQMNNDEMAQIHLERAMALNPDSAPAFSLEGVLREREGDSDGAAKYYKKAVSIDSGYSPGHANYGGFLLRQGQYAEAEKQLSDAGNDIGYAGRDEALANLGRAAAKLGDVSLARQSFVRSLNIRADAPDVVFEFAQLQFDNGDTAGAHRLYGQYTSLIQNQAAQNARTLWLGIRLERIYGDRNALASYELALTHLFPESPEYKAYLQSGGQSAQSSQ